MNDAARDGWSHATRARFDAIVESVLASLPPALHTLLEESPLIVEDAPSRELMCSLGIDTSEDDLCGLHTGISITERSVTQSGELPDVIQIFRRGILDAAGGWEEWIDEDGESLGGTARVEQEIRITILHEIGHHFGLSEEDLDRLGYG
ncbi:MAG: metallopeptidase family protein [Phycisphaerales bacterium]|nr:metallopeptidase family protein [Phycisphaerales bacterium]